MIQVFPDVPGSANVNATSSVRPELSAHVVGALKESFSSDLVCELLRHETSVGDDARLATEMTLLLQNAAPNVRS